MKSLIKYPVKLNTKYSLSLRMLCMDLLDPLGLKSTSLVILRPNVIINSALKRVLKPSYTFIIMLFNPLYMYTNICFPYLGVLFLESFLYNHDTLTSFSVYL